MNKENACFQHLKRVTSPFIKFLYSLAAKPNLVSRKAFGKTCSYCHLVCLCFLSGCNDIPVTLQRYFLVDFTLFECLDVQRLHLLQKKRNKKTPCTVTKITKQPLKLYSLPGWYMKNMGLSYLFVKNSFLDNRFGLAARD